MCQSKAWHNIERMKFGGGMSQKQEKLMASVVKGYAEMLARLEFKKRAAGGCIEVAK